MEFRVDFGAEDEARLSPCKDDKPKYIEITPFQADLGYFLSAILTSPVHKFSISPFSFFTIRE